MRAMGVQWGLTGVEVDPETGKTLTVDFVMLPFNRRDKDTIGPHIVQRMNVGGTVMTDGWAADAKAVIEDARCIHFTVNHSENFKDPLTGKYTNNVEGHYYESFFR